MGRHVILMLFFLLARSSDASAQRADSWATVKQQRGGEITALWYDIDPYIFEDSRGTLQGVEYELMQSFVAWINAKYGYELKVNWKNASSFENIYNQIRDARVSGLFGWSFFSITPERQSAVRFTPPYMPDINVVVTNDAMPLFKDQQSFLDTLPHLHGYTMAQTAMEEDLEALVAGYDIPIFRQYEDYAIMDRIATEKDAFGYVPLTVYVVSLQKGIKVKRQYQFATERPGLAGIFPKSSDWQEVVDAYFQSFECKRTVTALLSKYLGSEIGKIIMEGPGISPEGQRDAELELLMKEREIVSQRLAATLLASERDKMLRNVSILLFIGVIAVSMLFYSRYRIKSHLTKLLVQRNTIIGKQNRDIERINRKLHMRVLQAQVNPHFLFNSLNDLQYFINKGEKKTAMSYLSNFSRYIRTLLKLANEPEITFQQEETFLKLYLDLERMRFTGRFDYVIAHDKSLPRDLSGIPPLIIYHYVENAIYHGILQSSELGEIKISFAYENPHLICTITDNGCSGKNPNEKGKKPRDSDDITPYKQLLEDRINMLNEEMPRRVTVDVHDLVSPDGTACGTMVILQMIVSSATQNQSIIDY